jgi:glycine C-acetyltransferase
MTTTVPASELDDLRCKDVLRFRSTSGPDLLRRHDPFLAWQQARVEAGLWPYFRRYDTGLGTTATAVSERGRVTHGANFGGQDYLSLSSHPAVLEAAVRALHDFGPVAAGSSALGGATPLHRSLEQGLGEALHAPQVMLFPTGWATGFGTIRSLMHRGDHVLLDRLAHDSLRQGAAASEAAVTFHDHLDNDDARRHLREIRAQNSRGAVLVVTEGVFSMDSDTPRLAELLELCREYDAKLLVDVAHDFAAMGEDGTGQLGLRASSGRSTSWSAPSPNPSPPRVDSWPPGPRRSVHMCGHSAARRPSPAPLRRCRQPSPWQRWRSSAPVRGPSGAKPWPRSPSACATV